MLISSSFSCFPLLVTLALLSRACLTAPAQIPPALPSSPFCNLLSAEYLKKEPPSNITLLTDVYYTLFSFTLIPTDASSSTSFTFTPEDDLEERPFPGSNGSFVLAMLDTGPSSVQSLQVISFRCIPFVGCSQLEIPCDTGPPQKLHLQMQASIVESDDGKYEERLDELSFTYLASIEELHVQVVQYYRDGLKINHTFSLSTPLYSDATQLNSSESVTLFVGYIARGVEASILPTGGPSGPNDSKHIRVMAWVVVGTLIIGTLLGSVIFVLYMMKGRKRPAVGLAASPPLARRAPAFSHLHDLESAPSLPAPLHSNAFQISGTASWLKHPTPR